MIPRVQRQVDHPGGGVRGKVAGALIALAFAGCGSEPETPSGPDPGGTGGPVTLAFSDSALQAAVEESGAGAEVVSLIAEDRGIADLEGIEQLTRLEALDLSHNVITDISPLAGLHGLRFLDLESNRIEDVSPLASLKRLQVLLLADNAVRDLLALAGLDSLQSLGLTGNPLSGSETTELLAGLRERGVTVDFEAPEGTGAGDDDVAPLKETQLLFSTSRGTGFQGHLELYSLDLESGKVVDLSVTLAMDPLADGSAPETSQSRRPSEGRFPARSPDGSRVAFASDRDGNREIYVMRGDGSLPENLTRHEAWDGDPCWSPDGLRIAFTSDRHGEREWGPPGSGVYNRDIYIMNADGTGVRQLTFDPVNAYDPAWSPDGLSIAFTSDRDVPNGPAAIHVVDLASGVDRRLYGSDHYAWDPSWSPDGAWIAFGQQSEDPRRSHVWVMAADGTGARQLTFAEAWVWTPTWSPDGTRIAFERDHRGDDVGSDIHIVSVDSGAEERITDHPGWDSDPNWTSF